MVWAEWVLILCKFLVCGIPSYQKKTTKTSTNYNTTPFDSPWSWLTYWLRWKDSGPASQVLPWMIMSVQPIPSRHTPPVGAWARWGHLIPSLYTHVEPLTFAKSTLERLRSRRHRYTKGLPASHPQTSKSAFLGTQYHHPYDNWGRSLVSLHPLQTPATSSWVPLRGLPMASELSAASPGGLPCEVPYYHGDTNKVCVSTSLWLLSGDDPNLEVALPPSDFTLDMVRCWELEWPSELQSCLYVNTHTHTMNIHQHVLQRFYTNKLISLKGPRPHRTRNMAFHGFPQSNYCQMLTFKLGTNCWDAYLMYQSGQDLQVLPASLVPTCYRVWLAYPPRYCLTLHPRGWAALPLEALLCTIQIFWLPALFELLTSWLLHLSLISFSPFSPHRAHNHDYSGLSQMSLPLIFIYNKLSSPP